MEPCVCSIVVGDTAAHVLLDEPRVFGFLDVRLVLKGHVLVVRRVHATMADVPSPLLATLLGQCSESRRPSQKWHGATGIFVAVNNVVSQSVPHVHVHVVPRTKG